MYDISSHWVEPGAAARKAHSHLPRQWQADICSATYHCFVAWRNLFTYGPLCSNRQLLGATNSQENHRGKLSTPQPAGKPRVFSRLPFLISPPPPTGAQTARCRKETFNNSNIKNKNNDLRIKADPKTNLLNLQNFQILPTTKL